MEKMRSGSLILLRGAIIFLTLNTGCKDALRSGLSAEQQQWVEETLENMTVEQKVGQLLAPAMAPPGSDRDQVPLNQVKEWIDKYHIGHVYLASHRMDPVRTAGFINNVQSASGIPLLIHSDFEPGPGGRFDGGTILPPLMGIAQTGSDSLAYLAASITAREARAIGIHLINSPVLDVNINPDNPVICIRSFGDDPRLVSEMGKAYVSGLNDMGLIGAAKHFPGHGDVSVDSHSKMPVLAVGRERLDSIEFYPYRQLIPAGLKAIMTAHISVPVLDPTPGLPATMSEPILTGVLREELGFDGLIITDAFDMGGILESGSFEESAVRSILAGNDIVLLWTKPRFETVFPYVVNAVKEGRISEARLNASVRRNLIAKAWVGLHLDKYVETEKIPGMVDTPEDRDRALMIYERSITLVKNQGSMLPLPAGDKKIAVLSVNDDNNHLHIARTFMSEIERRTETSSTISIDPQTPADVLKKALAEAEKADVIVVGLFARIMARRGSASLINDGLVRFLQDLAEGDTPVFVVSFGSPYLISRFPEVDGYMVATEPTWDFYGYDKYRPGQIAAAEALFGEIDITGKLSVNIPDLYPSGHGIFYKAD
jgi:beta-N-acetylhexosaminidase